MTKRKQPSTSIEAEASDCSKIRAMPSSSEQLVAVPVEGNSSGEGLPYAPEGWPHPGDVWRWKVKNRKSSSGFWKDRYLYPPPGFPKIPRGRTWFESKLAVRDYLQKEFPSLDVDAFFASFLWRVPAGERAKNKKDLCQEQGVDSEQGAFEKSNSFSDEVTMLANRSVGPAVAYPKNIGHPSNLHVNGKNKIMSVDESVGPIYIAADHRDASMKLDDDKNKALQELKVSQESVYETIQRQLSSQKDLLINLYQQLDRERFQLAALPPNIDGSSGEGDPDALLGKVLEIVDRIKVEEMKLRGMMNIVKELQLTSRGLLAKYFGNSC